MVWAWSSGLGKEVTELAGTEDPHVLNTLPLQMHVGLKVGTCEATPAEVEGDLEVVGESFSNTLVDKVLRFPLR